MPSGETGSRGGDMVRYNALPADLSADEKRAGDAGGSSWAGTSGGDGHSTESTSDSNSVPDDGSEVVAAAAAIPVSRELQQRQGPAPRTHIRTASMCSRRVPSASGGGSGECWCKGDGKDWGVTARLLPLVAVAPPPTRLPPPVRRDGDGVGGGGGGGTDRRRPSRAWVDVGDAPVTGYSRGPLVPAASRAAAAARDANVPVDNVSGTTSEGVVRCKEVRYGLRRRRPQTVQNGATALGSDVRVAGDEKAVVDVQTDMGGARPDGGGAVALDVSNGSAWTGATTVGGGDTRAVVARGGGGNGGGTGGTGGESPSDTTRARARASSKADGGASPDVPHATAVAFAGATVV